MKEKMLIKNEIISFSIFFILIVSLFFSGCIKSEKNGDMPIIVTQSPTQLITDTPITSLLATESPDPTKISSPEPSEIKKGNYTKIVISNNDELGSFLVTENGMTLYYLHSDVKGKGSCKFACAQTWPPLEINGELIAGEDISGELSIIERDDGLKQVTYNGIPLYLHLDDTVAGDTKGQWIANKWFVVSPELSLEQLRTIKIVTVTPEPEKIISLRVGEKSELGNFIVDNNNVTLYYTINDTVGKSNCYRSCATDWPPYLILEGIPINAPDVPGGIGVIERFPGIKQITYNGMPLYYSFLDLDPGDTEAHGGLDMYFVVPLDLDPSILPDPPQIEQ